MTLARIILLVSAISASYCEVPNDFQIRLDRDRTDLLRVRAYFQREDGQTRYIRPWLKSTNCGSENRNGRHSLVFNGANNTRAHLDISDMVMYMEGHYSVMGLCISYRAALTRSVDSILYLSQTDGHENLVLNPASPGNYSATGSIEYTNIRTRDGIINVRVMASDPSDDSVPINAPIDDLIFAINGGSMSTISQESYSIIQRAIGGLGGHIRSSSIQSEVYLDNCYNRLIQGLPAIHIFLHDSPNPTDAASTRLIIYPQDYISPTEVSHVCKIHVEGAHPNEALVLTNHLIQTIGGVHFDYTNERIGLFDPI